MTIFYCEKCGVRIPDGDIASGAAATAGEGRYICPACGPSKASKVLAPASGRSRKDSTVMIPPPAKTRVLPAPARTGGSTSAAGIVGGIGAIVLLGVVILAFSGSRPTPEAKPDSKAGVSPAPVLPPKPDSLPPPSRPDEALKASEADTPRDTIARRDLDAIRAWAREHPDDPYAVADRIAGFLVRHRTSRYGPEASRLLADLKAPSRVDAPLAHWPFDDGTGTSARDRAGGMTATLRGEVRLVEGRVGSGAVSFAGGREDFLDLGTDPKLNFAAGAPFTIAGWFKTSEANAALVSFRNSANESTCLDIAIGHHGAARVPGRLMAIVRQDGGGKFFGSVTGKPANDGAWHHFALTRNREGTLRLFLDGEFQGMHTNTETGGALTTDLRSCGLEVLWTRNEKAPDPSGQGLKGEMDDLRIYSCALMETEIRELANLK